MKWRKFRANCEYRYGWELCSHPATQADEEDPICWSRDTCPLLKNTLESKSKDALIIVAILLGALLFFGVLSGVTECIDPGRGFISRHR